MNVCVDEQAYWLKDRQASLNSNGSQKGVMYLLLWAFLWWTWTTGQHAANQYNTGGWPAQHTSSGYFHFQFTNLNTIQAGIQPNLCNIKNESSALCGAGALDLIPQQSYWIFINAIEKVIIIFVLTYVRFCGIKKGHLERKISCIFAKPFSPGNNQL